MKYFRDRISFWSFVLLIVVVFLSLVSACGIQVFVEIPVNPHKRIALGVGIFQFAIVGTEGDPLPEVPIVYIRGIRAADIYDLLTPFDLWAKDHGYGVQYESGVNCMALWILFAVYPLGSIIRGRSERKRRVAGQKLCLNCGYDLRGSPGLICPECGHVISPKQLPESHDPSTNNVLNSKAQQ